MKNVTSVIYGNSAFLLGLGAGLCAPLSACLGGEDREPRDIVPLAVGNTWTYVDSAFYGDDSLAVDTTVVSVTGTREVPLEGRTQTVFVENTRDRLTGLPSAISLYVQNSGHSHYTCGAEEDGARVLGKVLHLRYPARAGDRYPTFFYGFTTVNGVKTAVIDTVDVEVGGTRLTCATPAGTFACVQYQGYLRDGALFATTYYAPGVGYLGSEVIRRETVGDSAREVRFVKKLAAYTLH